MSASAIVTNPAEINMFTDEPMQDQTTTVEWFAWKVYCIPYAIVDGTARLISNINGLDKLNKLVKSYFCFLIKYYDGTPFSMALSGVNQTLKTASEFISAMLAVDRTKAVLALDKDGKSEFAKEKSGLKRISTAFLAFGKNMEFIKWLQSINFVAKDGSHFWDVDYLSSVSGKIGLKQVFAPLSNIGLVRGKNYAIIISSVYSIFDTVEKMYRIQPENVVKGDLFIKHCLGIANELGKITMCSLPMLLSTIVDTYLFNVLGMVTAIIAISKILWDSYRDPVKGKPLEIPYWV